MIVIVVLKLCIDLYIYEKLKFKRGFPNLPTHGLSFNFACVILRIQQLQN